MVASSIEGSVNDLTECDEAKIADGDVVGWGIDGGVFFVGKFGWVFVSASIDVIFVGEGHPHESPDGWDGGLALIIEMFEE